ncbi:MAG: hypothetical protein FRX49_00237 [Trebouxia sp. A1-2]|nr:MAG: hypothetical protein FRX49_00237 [Trebouxia sp. A1-2]
MYEPCVLEHEELCHWSRRQQPHLYIFLIRATEGLHRLQQLPLMSAESLQLQTGCEGRPEGISKGCAHAPLMVQEAAAGIAQAPIAHQLASDPASLPHAQQLLQLLVAELRQPRHSESSAFSVLQACKLEK